MSKENVKAFFAEMEKNQKLHTECVKFLQESEAGSAEALSQIVTFGKSAGFQFTEDNMKEYCSKLTDGLHENCELSDEDLQQVAGGFCKINSILISISGLGLACAGVSIYAQIKKMSCAQVLSATDENCHD